MTIERVESEWDDRAINELRQAIRSDRRLLGFPARFLESTSIGKHSLEVGCRRVGNRDRTYEVGSRRSSTELPVLSPNLDFDGDRYAGAKVERESLDPVASGRSPRSEV